MDKNVLDAVLELHKAQPVGDGYIDIIVSRENCNIFIKDLVENGFAIKSISWWEWCAHGKECQYGLGGPESYYHDGWFAELPIDVDDIEIGKRVSKEEVIHKIKSLIEKKSIVYPDEIVSFAHHKWLTPAIWLDVPEDWRNKYSCNRSV
jgi:hypothetical protein